MKKNIFKNILLTVLTLILVSLTITVSYASDYYENCGTFNIHMSDQANLLTDQEESDLIDFIKNKFYDMHYDVLILTYDDAQGKSTMSYSDDYMDNLFAEDDNIGFVIDMDNREVYINTMGKAIQCLTDARIDSAIDSGYSYLVDQDYKMCLQKMIEYCANYMSDDPSEVGYDPSYGKTNFLSCTISAIIPSIIATAIFVVFMIFRHNKANRAQSATTYVSNDDYKVVDKDEVFVRSYETVVHDYYKPKSDSSGGSSHGGGSSHSSSSGRSHGGGGREF